MLDTWFSSALWPFSTLGWPDRTPALAKFYPTNPEQTSDLETGYDILFFWVARMIMFGLHFTGEVPFRRVLLSGLIVDETGDKMSKVKGNVIDPLDLIRGTTFAEMVKKTLPGAPEKEALAKFKKAYPSAASMGAGFPAFGADAVRFTLATYPPSNMRIALAPRRIEGNRHFLNKVWNATRLSLELLGDFSPPAGVPAPEDVYDRWILARLHDAVVTVRRGMGSFRIDEAANELYRFFWYDFCDWYLELVKPVLREPASHDAARVAATKGTLLFVLDSSLRLLHPFVPFVTEELWQRLPGTKPAKSIALCEYPDAEAIPRDEAVLGLMATFQAVVSAARTIRSEHEVKPGDEVPLRLRASADAALAFAKARAATIKVLVKTVGNPVFEPTGGPRPAGSMTGVVPSPDGPIEVLVGLKGLVTKDAELARIDRELKKLDKDLAAIDKKLGSPAFVDKAPKEVVEEAREQRKRIEEAKARLVEARGLAEEL